MLNIHDIMFANNVRVNSDTKITCNSPGGNTLSRPGFLEHSVQIACSLKNNISASGGLRP